MNKTLNMLIPIAALALAGLACNLDVGGPAVPDTPAPVSTQQAGSLVEAWEQAFEIGKDTGTVSLTLTEEQMTSFLALSIAEQENPLLTDPQVDLREGEMEILGTYEADAISANVGIVMEVSVNEEGVPVIEVTSGSLGPLPLPAELLQGISELINQALTGQVGTTATGFTLQSIVISEGSITLNGILD